MLIFNVLPSDLKYKKSCIHFWITLILTDHFHSNISPSSKNTTNLLRCIINNMCNCTSNYSDVHYLNTRPRKGFSLSLSLRARFGNTASVYILLIFPNFSILVVQFPLCASCLLPGARLCCTSARRPSGELQPVGSAPLRACSWGRPWKIQHGNLPYNIINSFL